MKQYNGVGWMQIEVRFEPFPIPTFGVPVRPQLRVSPGYEVIEDFLTGGFIIDAEDCSELLKVIDKLSSGELSEWGSDGNAYSLKLSSAEACATSYYFGVGKGYNEDEMLRFRLPLDDFREIVTARRDQLLGCKEPIELSVNYSDNT